MQRDVVVKRRRIFHGPFFMSTVFELISCKMGSVKRLSCVKVGLSSSIMCSNCNEQCSLNFMFEEDIHEEEVVEHNQKNLEN